MSKRDDAPFFVGYLNPPKKLRSFLWVVGLSLIAGFAALSLAIGSTQDDPGGATFRFGWGPQTVTGVLEATPEPILHITKGTDRLPANRSVMLSGAGKRGVHTRANPLDGKLVTASGIVLQRGNLDMLQLRGGRNGMRAAQGSPPSIPTKPLGRWKLTGEICDGKCLAGAMRPGRGLSHKACANFCLIGGAPPVFVSTAPVDGTIFFLLSDIDGKPLGSKVLDHVAQYIVLEGEIEKRGNLHIFRADFAMLTKPGSGS